MNEILDAGKNIIIGGADGPTSIFIAGQVGQTAMIVAIAVGLLICLFGLKLVRVLSAIAGLGLGAVIGGAVAVAVGTEGSISLVIVIACAVVLAAVSFFLYRFGLFCMTLLYTAAIGISLFPTLQMITAIIILVVALILAVLAAVFTEPLVIIVTGINGGLAAGTSIAVIAGLGDPAWIGYAIGGGLALIGMAVQFMMHSRKIGKKEKKYSKEVKEKVSVESEVEKARMILDDSEDDE